MKTSRRIRLSAHFRVTEFRQSDTRKLPPPNVDAALKQLCRTVLEPLRTRFGVCTIISGSRTHAHNSSVGGAAHSHHLYDEWPSSPAADVRFARGTPEEWHAAAEHLMPRGGLGKYPTHIHVDLRPDRARW